MNLLGLLHERRAMEGMADEVVNVLRRIRDPEIPANIFDLGLVYGLDIDADGKVTIRMTLTTPNCPMAQSFPAQVEQAVRSVEGVTDVHVDLVWDPPWDRSRMSETALLELGLM